MDLPVLGWRLWYADGSIVSSADTDWDDAPITGVQVLEYLHEAPYRTLAYGHDEYRLDEQSTPKYGQWMDTAAFELLVDRVINP